MYWIVMQMYVFILVWSFLLLSIMYSIYMRNQNYMMMTVEYAFP